MRRQRQLSMCDEATYACLRLPARIDAHFKGFAHSALESAMQKYDLIVIGPGRAGQRAAIQGAKLGKRVAPSKSVKVVGGACINTGTIPDKSMREAVMYLSGYQYQSIYGMNYRVKEKIEPLPIFAFRVQHVIKTEIDVTLASFSRKRDRCPIRHGMVSGSGSPADRKFKGSIRIRSRHRGNCDRHPARRTARVPLNGRTI